MTPTNTPAQGSGFNPFEVQSDVIKGWQKQAELRNTQRLNAYAAQCSQWIIVANGNREKGVPLPPMPLKPQQEVVDDAGNTTWTEFPNLTLPVLPPEVKPVQKLVGLSGTPNAPTIDDKLNKLYQMLAAQEAVLKGIQFGLTVIHDRIIQNEAK